MEFPWTVRIPLRRLHSRRWMQTEDNGIGLPLVDNISMPWDSNASTWRWSECGEEFQSWLWHLCWWRNTRQICRNSIPIWAREQAIRHTKTSSTKKNTKSGDLGFDCKLWDRLKSCARIHKYTISYMGWFWLRKVSVDLSFRKYNYFQQSVGMSIIFLVYGESSAHYS